MTRLKSVLENVQLEGYMKLPYIITIQPLVQEADGDTGFVAWCEDLGRCSCTGWGETIQDAVTAMQGIKRELFRRCLKEGLEIPLPNGGGLVK